MAETKNLNETLKFKFVMGEIRNSLSPYNAYGRLIKTSAYHDTLKEVAMNLKVQLADDSESFYNYLKTYAKFRGLNENATVAEIYQAYLEDCEVYCKENNNKFDQWVSPVYRFITDINYLIKTINRQIDFIRSTYKIEESNDTRFNKTTAEKVYATREALDYWNYDIEQGAQERTNTLKSTNKDVFTDDAGRLICKKLNSFKSDLINNFNRTFGDKSVYAELKLSELLQK